MLAVTANTCSACLWCMIDALSACLCATTLTFGVYVAMKCMHGVAGTHIEANYIQKSEDKMSSSRLTDEDRYRIVPRLFRDCSAHTLYLHDDLLMQLQFVSTARPVSAHTLRYALR
jgi:hypothetical protein